MGAGLQNPQPAIPNPLLIAVGDSDKVGTTRASSRDWARERPDADFKVIPQAGHCANQDDPQFTNRTWAGFSRHTPRTNRTAGSGRLPHRSL